MYLCCESKKEKIIKIIKLKNKLTNNNIIEQINN